MDPRDRLREKLAGVGCTACGAGVPADRIDILAERAAWAFVQVRCPGCGSDALGLVVGDAGPEDTTDASAGGRYGEFGPEDERRLTGPAIGGDDVRRMHAFLDRYDGDLRSLLGPRRGSHRPGAG